MFAISHTGHANLHASLHQPDPAPSVPPGVGSGHARLGPGKEKKYIKTVQRLGSIVYKCFSLMKL